MSNTNTTTTTTQSLIFANYPEGLIKESDFQYNDQVPFNLETSLDMDEVMVQLLHISVDPYLRGRMRKNPMPKHYAGTFQTGKPISSGCVAKVLKSNHSLYREGDIVVGHFEWQTLQIVKIGQENVKNYSKVDPNVHVPLSFYLGSLGMPGMTAYFGFLDICQPKEGEVVLVSAASGAVGSLVGQLAKLKGCKVIGITGQPAEHQQELKDLGFDVILNYKDYNNDPLALKDAIEKAAEPKNGIDCYFDNVGGFILEAATLAMNRYGRISCCGSISDYNIEDRMSNTGPRLNYLYITRELNVRGFIVGSFYNRLDEGVKAMTQWVTEGKLKVLESKVEGLENVPKALIKLFTGDKVGKMIVDL